MPASERSPAPVKRSAADLQKILDSLIGTSGSVLAGDLPDVLLAYENKHDTTILDPSEYEGLRTLCGDHSEMELGATELFQFLSMIQNPPPSSSPTAASSHQHVASTYDTVEQSTPIQGHRKQNRRQSDRIRSPSDTSGTSSSSEDETVHQQRLTRQTSAPPPGTAFPASSSAVQAVARPVHPKRKKTVSDPSRLDSPLATRLTRSGGAPPSSFGGGFARPSPASRRRRGSQSDNEDRSPDHSGRFGRSVSTQNMNVASPTWSSFGGRNSGPASPISPGLDHTSFHSRAKSPEEVRAEEEEMQAEMYLDREGSEAAHDAEDDIDETDDIVGHGMMGAGEAMIPRLSRISTESTTSLRTSHDKLQALQKQNTELSRKLKESEKQLALLGADNDRMVVDLERQLEEARHELAQKRKDDKELRGHELKQNIQISGLEADLANVQRTLEQSKEHRANMQKMYDSQCDEAQRLRDMLRDRDSEIRGLEESVAEHEADEAKYAREMQALEAEVKRLEGELATARQAESVLETQKQENLQLKETIDRMRFDLEEAKNNAVNAGKGHGRTATTNSSVKGTLSRNLGDEINRKLLDAQAVAEDDAGDEDTGEGEGDVETVVTIQRTRKLGSRKVSNPNGKASGSASLPAIQIEEEEREYADAGTSTEPVRVLPIEEDDAVPEGNEAGPSASMSAVAPQDHPPAYTAKPETISEQEVLDRCHPRATGLDTDTEHDYDTLVGALGVRCHVLEEEMKAQKGDRAKRGPVTSSTRPTRTSQSVGVINNIVYVTQDALTGKMAAYIFAGFAVGLMAGSHFLTGGNGIHPRDAQLFLAFNTLAQSVGAGEGVLPGGAKGLAGVVGAGAGLGGWVPT